MQNEKRMERGTLKIARVAMSPALLGKAEEQHCSQQSPQQSPFSAEMCSDCAAGFLDLGRPFLLTTARSFLLLAMQNYLPPPRRPDFGRSREGYGRYDFSVFPRIWVSTVDLATQSSILLSGSGGR